jgi:hypothetical protein
VYKRILAASTAAATLTLTLGLATVPASADVPSLDIGAIGYNAYGADVVGNRNAEYIDIKNVSTTPAPVNVAGLVVQDAWSHGRNYTRGCNAFTVRAGALPVATGTTPDELPAGHTLRVYVGEGTPAARGTFHTLYMNSSVRCGFNGHFLNNGPSGNRYAAWDTVWITLNNASESKGYNFTRGYVAP